jgi:hypothetical protein
MGKFSNFATDSKMFEIFLPIQFFKKIPANSKKLAGNLPMAHHLCIPVAHWRCTMGKSKISKKIEFCSRPTYP